MAITKRQREAFEFIREFMLKNQVTPSVREIADGVGAKSLSSVHSYVKALKKAGYIIPYDDKSIRFSIKGIRMVEVADEDPTESTS